MGHVLPASHRARSALRATYSGAARITSIAFLPLAAAGLLAAAAAAAQTYPSKPIRIISTFGNGSIAEVNIRMVTQKMSESLGQPVLVDGRPGAGGIVGAVAVANAAPDGYTLLFANSYTITTSPLLMKQKPFDAKDFTPITVAFAGSSCIVVNAALPVRSIKDLVDYIRRNPGKLAYGHNGIGGTYHLQMESIKLQFGLDIIGIAYKGGTAALMDTVTGTIPTSFTATGSAEPFVRSGKVRMLGIIDDRRNPDLPDVPALSEDLPGFEKLPSGLSFYGPAGLPQPIVLRLQQEIGKGLSVPDIVAKHRAGGFYYVANTPEQFAAQQKRDMEIVARAVKAAGLKPE